MKNLRRHSPYKRWKKLEKTKFEELIRKKEKKKKGTWRKTKRKLRNDEMKNEDEDDEDEVKTNDIKEKEELVEEEGEVTRDDSALSGIGYNQ